MRGMAQGQGGYAVGRQAVGVKRLGLWEPGRFERRLVALVHHALPLALELLCTSLVLPYQDMGN